jgi:hypothetical protein
VEFVHDHDVEMVGIEMVQTSGVQALDRREDMVEAPWARAPHPELAEGRIAECMMERREALFKDLPAVSDEDPEGTSSPTASPHGIQERAHAAPADEGHDDIDPFC